MKEFIDRVSSGKKIIKYENGTTETVTIENAEDATVQGTPINRENMMAVQGFVNSVTSYNRGTKTVNAGDGVLRIWFEDDVLVEEFSGEKTITKKTYFTVFGEIREVIL